MPTETGGDADLSAIGALLAEPARASVLLALADGRRLPASMLASEAGVAPSTMSEHLARLVEGGLIVVHRHGRHRYYEMAGPEVGRLIETVAQLSPRQPVRSLREGTKAYRLRLARHCYDHMGGRLAVAITQSLLDRSVLTGHDGSINFDVDQRLAGGLDPVAYTVSPDGSEWLRKTIGVDCDPSPPVHCCNDWTEQRHHLAGPLGTAVLTRKIEMHWVQRSQRDRSLTITDLGSAALVEHFGLSEELVAQHDGNWDN